jgi:hypothetical protein
MNQPTTSNAMIPSAAPTPMPALAPVVRLLLEVFDSVLVNVGLEMAEDEEEVICVVGCVAEVVDNDSKVDEAATEPTNTGATVILLFGSLQQMAVSPQHHVVELAVPSQGVTRTSVF